MWSPSMRWLITIYYSFCWGLNVPLYHIYPSFPEVRKCMHIYNPTNKLPLNLYITELSALSTYMEKC